MLVSEPSHFKIIIKVRLASFEKLLSGEKIPNFSSPEPASILNNLYREHSNQKQQNTYCFQVCMEGCFEMVIQKKCPSYV